ncbi:DctP family TRAP transporter solute-binding subunit [Lutispora sp.]|uniref:DctP family TRAP transporter solute-binding subunit n=1 Tax=Lutispora sp. TaxID=2828727 RepID=UPI00356241CE
MRKRTIKILSLILSLIIILTGCAKPAEQPAASSSGDAKAEKPIELKMGITSSETSSWYQGALKFAELVKERTNGKYDIKVYPNEQLSGGNQAKSIELLKAGAMDLSLHSNIIYSVMDEKFSVVSLPWLMPDNETVDEKIHGEGGEALKKLLLNNGIVGLGFGENGFRQLTNSKKEVRTPEDIKNMKIRIPGMKMYISLFTALETDPITMNWSEVFTALQQKTVDGHENPLDTIQSAKIHEIQDYLTIWNYSYDTIILGMNKAKFDSLDAETQKIFQESAVEAMAYQVKLNRELEAKHLENFKQIGMKITVLTPEEIAAFREKVQSVYDEYEEKIGKELLDAFR